MRVEITSAVTSKRGKTSYKVLLHDGKRYASVYTAAPGYRHSAGSVEFLQYRGKRFFLTSGCAASEAWLNEFTPAFKVAVAEWLLMHTAAEIEKKLEILESEK